MSTERFGASLCIALIFVASELDACIDGAERPFDVAAISDAVRVFEDGYGWLAGAPVALEVFGLRGEVLSAQCAIQAREELEELTVTVGPLRSDDGSAEIAAEQIQWRFVESIAIEENTRKLKVEDLTRQAPARFPDCLVEDRHSSMASGMVKAVYITVRVPVSAEPGTYRGAVTVAANGVERSLRLVLQVYPLTLPEERHLLVTLWYSTRGFRQHHGIDPADPEQFDRLLKKYAENMADHRQNVFRVGLELIDCVLAADGVLRCDFDRFDRWADIFWDTGRMDAMETGFVARHGEGGWSSSEITLRDFQVKDEVSGQRRRMAGEEFLPLFLPMLVDHLRQKGWLEKTLFHICDEPANHNVLLWREASDLVHRHAPQLRRIEAIETTHCRDRLEVWVPKLDHLAAWQQAYEAAQRDGYELWLYTVGIYQAGSLPNKTVDVPLIESRLLHWLNYRYRLAGYLHWGFNAWTDDPVSAPGKHHGDGWHVYPKPGGLLDSLRWEQMRAGIQDYECLKLLEDKLAQIHAELSPRARSMIDPARRGVEISSQVVRNYNDCTRDPDVLYAARRQAIEEACDVDRSPRAILQTNPPEHSTVANDTAIDVYGWAEPGATVTVDGRQTPVAADGLFFANGRASRDGTVRVVVRKDADEKRFTRRFRLQFDPAGGQKSVNVVLLADEKDHGPAGNGLHDYPLWQQRWARLLVGESDSAQGQARPVVSIAWDWPSEQQFQTADVIVAYCYLDWTGDRLAQVRRYLARGGGLVLIHSATWTRPEPSPEVARLVGVGGFQLFRHGAVQMTITAPEHPICSGLPGTIVLDDDETYWPPTPLMDGAKVLATSVEEKGARGVTPKNAQPMLWCYEAGRGRVFGCVPGHKAATFDDPLFRQLLLRGIAWAAGQSPQRWDALAGSGQSASASNKSRNTIPKKGS